jgi:hypothetical protein
MKTLLERVENRVTKTPSGCWIWHGAKSGTTPVIRVQGKLLSLRRALTQRDDPLLMASCGDNRCVAPEHIDNKLEMGARLARLAGTTDPEVCWYVDARQQPQIGNTTARRAAYRHFIGPTRRPILTTFCHMRGCFNPWHVTPEPQWSEPDHALETAEIEDCVCFLLEFPGQDPTRFYDEPTIAAAKRRIEEEGL